MSVCQYMSIVFNSISHESEKNFAYYKLNTKKKKKKKKTKETIV